MVNTTYLFRFARKGYLPAVAPVNVGRELRRGDELFIGGRKWIVDSVDLKSNPQEAVLEAPPERIANALKRKA